MRPFDRRNIFADAGGLDAAEHRAGVGQRAEVGEGQVGRSEIDGIAGRSLDAQLRRDIGLKAKVRKRVVAVPVEAEGQYAERFLPEIAGIRQVGADARAAGVVPKTEELGGIAVAALPVQIERQTVALAHVLIQPHAEVVGVLGDRSQDLIILHLAGLVGGREKVEQP